MKLTENEDLSNFVPADAVKRGGLVLFIITGRKGHVGGNLSDT